MVEMGARKKKSMNLNEVIYKIEKQSRSARAVKQRKESRIHRSRFRLPSGYEID